LALLYVYGVAYKAFFISLREPLRDGAPKAFLPKRLSSTTLLSLLLLSNLRKEPYELSPKRYVPGLLPNTFPSLSFFSSLFIADSVRSCTQVKKKKKKDNRREERPFVQRSWGATFAKGLKNDGEESARIKQFANGVVSSLTLVNNQSFGQCALAFAPIECKCIVMNGVKKWMKNYVAVNFIYPAPLDFTGPVTAPC
jgi:hypothetical protein